MKIKTADLIGLALDWAVAKCEAVEVEYINDGITRCILRVSPFTGMYRPSVDWAIGGPLIQRENLGLEKCRLDGPYQWAACDWHSVVVQGYTCLERSKYVYGPGPLIAAMRLVASRLGDEVDVPDELV